jgi:hypothetical protein
MTLLNKLKDGLTSIWPVSSPPRLPDESESEALERFRAAMLALIEGNISDQAARLSLRIRCAASLQSLWFMRSEMMALLAAEYGELEARHRLEQVSESVRDALPSGLRSRPSPLAREA